MDILKVNDHLEATRCGSFTKQYTCGLKEFTSTVEYNVFTYCLTHIKTRASGEKCTCVLSLVQLCAT